LISRTLRRNIAWRSSSSSTQAVPARCAPGRWIDSGTM
jgi:hypothetical protein